MLTLDPTSDDKLQVKLMQFNFHAIVHFETSFTLDVWIFLSVENWKTNTTMKEWNARELLFLYLVSAYNSFTQQHRRSEKMPEAFMKLIRVYRSSHQKLWGASCNFSTLLTIWPKSKILFSLHFLVEAHVMDVVVTIEKACMV